VADSPVSTFETIEAIKRVKARYFRTMDTKDWDAMRLVFTDDVVIDTTDSGGNVVEGADEFMAFLRETLDPVVTAHHGHTPEIDLTSPTTAQGIWTLQDLLIFPDGTRLLGFGHYHETYRLEGDEWKIASSRLTRLHMDVTVPDGGAMPSLPSED
jgi:hypothetical protein